MNELESIKTRNLNESMNCFYTIVRHLELMGKS